MCTYMHMEYLHVLIFLSRVCEHVCTRRFNKNDSLPGVVVSAYHLGTGGSQPRLHSTLEPSWAAFCFKRQNRTRESFLTLALLILIL